MTTPTRNQRLNLRLIAVRRGSLRSIAVALVLFVMAASVLITAPYPTRPGPGLSAFPGARLALAKALAEGQSHLKLRLATSTVGVSDMAGSREGTSGKAGSSEGAYRKATYSEGTSGLERLIRRLGGQVTFSVPEAGYLVANVPVEKVGELLDRGRVRAAEVDRKVAVQSRNATRTPPDINPAEAFQINLDSIRADSLIERVKTDGRGVTIAIIDTGVDPGHPDLALTKRGWHKVSDWVDFTGEGNVDTSTAVPSYQGAVDTAFGRYKLGSVTSASGRFYFGVFRESELDPGGEIGRDINRNGSTRDQFGILVVDPDRAGVYQTVYVDTNKNLDFSDEIPMGIYRDRRSVAYFGRDLRSTAIKEQTAFVVTQIGQDGKLVNLGFDGNGHGTHIAGIAAAGGFATGGFRGIAPGAQIMSLKALNSVGEGTWENISRAVTYAAEKGADIVSVSVGLDGETAPDGPEAQLISSLARKYNLLIIMAAGNNGPGIGSAIVPGSPRDSLTIGAYYSPESWKRDYGYIVPREGLWDLSAMGPRRNGALAVDLVAPGSAISTVPQWQSTNGFDLIDGTSMSAPHVAGVAALLIEAARARGLSRDYLQLKRAIEMGARPLSGFQVVEQGHGLLNASQAWDHLLRIGRSPAEVDVSLEGLSGEGLNARGFSPGRISYSLRNRNSRLIRLNLVGSSPWLRPQKDTITLPPGRDRALPVTYDLPARVGLYSAFLIGDDPETYGPDVEILNTVIQPYQFTRANGWQVSVSGKLDPARYQRYFYQVPQGASALSFNLRLPRDERSRPRGQGSFQVLRPDGKQINDPVEIGIGSNLTSTASFRVDNPQPGVWEAVVISSPALSKYGLTSTSYEFDATMSGFELNPSPLRLAVDTPRGTLSQDVTLTNYSGAFTGRVIGIGLTTSGTSGPAEVAYTSTGRPMTRSFELKGLTPLLRLEVSSPTVRGADLDLYLYRYNSMIKDYEEYAVSAQPGNSRETIEVAFPPPGQYIVYVETYGAGSSRVGFEYRRLVARDRGNVDVIDSNRYRARGSRWTVTVQIKVPDEAGKYYGQLLVRDSQNNDTRFWVPLEMDVGQPKVRARVLPTQLVRGQPGTVTLELREASSRALLDLPVKINGQLYQAQEGLVTIPVTPKEDFLDLETEVDFKGYSLYLETHRISVYPRRPIVLPLNEGDAEEKRVLRRKFMELRQ